MRNIPPGPAERTDATNRHAVCQQVFATVSQYKPEVEFTIPESRLSYLCPESNARGGTTPN